MRWITSLSGGHFLRRLCDFSSLLAQNDNAWRHFLFWKKSKQTQVLLCHPLFTLILIVNSLVQRNRNKMKFKFKEEHTFGTYIGYIVMQNSLKSCTRICNFYFSVIQIFLFSPSISCESLMITLILDKDSPPVESINQCCIYWARPP